MAISTDAKVIDERAEQALNAHDFKAIEEMYAPDAELVWPGGAAKRGRQAIVEHWRNQIEAFPDMHGAVQERVVEGDRVASEFTITGTNTGPQHLPDGGTVPPTGKPISVHGAAVVVVADGRIVRDHYYFDEIEILAQLGLMPAQTAAPQQPRKSRMKKPENGRPDPTFFW